MKKMISTVMAALLVMAISIPAFAANETIEAAEAEVVEVVELEEDTASKELTSEKVPETETVAAPEAPGETAENIGRPGSVKTLIFGSILICFGGVLIFVANKKGSGKKT